VIGPKEPCELENFNVKWIINDKNNGKLIFKELKFVELGNLQCILLFNFLFNGDLLFDYIFWHCYDILFESTFFCNVCMKNVMNTSFQKSSRLVHYVFRTHL
jgi:hypothetical protein